MDKIAKSGAIVNIAAAAIMFIWSLLTLIDVVPLFSQLAEIIGEDEEIGTGVVNVVRGIIIGIFSVCIIFAVINFIFSGLILGGKNVKAPAGIFAIIAIFFGLMFWYIPAVLFLIGAVLVLSGKRKEDDIENIDQVQQNVEIVP